MDSPLAEELACLDFAVAKWPTYALIDIVDLYMCRCIYEPQGLRW